MLQYLEMCFHSDFYVGWLYKCPFNTMFILLTTIYSVDNDIIFHLVDTIIHTLSCVLMHLWMWNMKYYNVSLHWQIQGALLACAPLSDQILSFLHTNFLECHCIRPWHPPYRVSAPPLQEILDPPLHWFHSFFDTTWQDHHSYKCLDCTL